MRKLTRTTATLFAGTMLATSVSIGGASLASASTCGYPPTQCGIAFNHGSYFSGGKVKFKSDRGSFKAGESVDGILRCKRHFRRLEGPFTAGPGKRVESHFRLPKTTPRGTCSLTLVGENSGRSAKGSFTVKHH